ncbi:polymeric immunoglobulin receptor-like [Engraulis encrasicolus]|uniref:polymeric immunoglobulin receptor-like n=1 Tax=Engraulis encrasicolus TaxID=184585 RepID=UPI002FD798B2
MSETCDLIIDQLKYNDEGVYTCTCDGGGQPVDRKLYVVAPVEVNVTAGDNVALPCYAGTTAGAKPYNLWRIIKDDKEQVLRFENGAFSFGKKMEGRVSASEEGYRSGDYSLYINNTLPSDSGLYICDYSETGDQEKFRGASRAFQLNVQGETWPISAIVVVTILGSILLGFLLHRYVGWGWLPKRCGTAEDRRSDQPSLSLMETGSHSTEPLGRQRKEESSCVTLEKNYE